MKGHPHPSKNHSSSTGRTHAACIRMGANQARRHPIGKFERLSTQSLPRHLTWPSRGKPLINFRATLSPLERFQ